MVRPPRQRGPSGEPDRHSSADQDLQAFLLRGGLIVLDVQRGSAPGTRRLVVGDPTTSSPAYVVAVAAEAAGAAAVEAEAELLCELADRLRPRMLATVPSVRGSIDVGQHVGSVLSAVPGTAAAWAQPPHESGIALLDWLGMLWADTAAGTAASDLGASAGDLLEARFGGAPAARELLDRVDEARAALAEVRLPRTASHGCLCPRHVHVHDGAVVGVDDWGLGSLTADPLRDLGCWAVSVAGSRLADVLAAEGTAGTALRDVTVAALRLLDVPDERWREVLLLASAEAAVAGILSHDLRAFHVLGEVCRQTIIDGDGART